jgi:hypothetical protein
MVDGERPTGRVDVVLADDRAWIGWLGRTDEGTAVMLRSLDLSATPPSLGAPQLLSRSDEARSSGFPRMVAAGGRLLIAWVDVESANGIRTAWVPLDQPAGTASARR